MQKDDAWVRSWFVWGVEHAMNPLVSYRKAYSLFVQGGHELIMAFTTD
jgi:hypothetical protein